MTTRLRFAPSPTGRLHVGNVRTALVNWLFARQSGGMFILRIDDTDRERSTAAYEDGIRTDLTWLGLSWDETFKQSERFDRYNAVRDGLITAGRLYPCYETAEELNLKRKVQLSRGLPPVYDRAALALSTDDKARLEEEGRKPHWRFKLDTPARIEWDDLVRSHQSIDMESLSDPILVREDGSYLYTLPSVVDDLDYNISHVVRGEDHVTNSAVQVQIFEAVAALDGNPPHVPAFAHLALLTGKGGEGLSKRLGTAAIADYRDEQGLEAMAINSLLARMGTSQPVEPFVSLEPLVESFSFDHFGRAAAKFDPEDLDLLNAKILHQTPFADVADRLGGIDEALWEALKPNLNKLGDIEGLRQLVFGPVTPDIEDAAYAATAASLLPDGVLDGDSWKAWTDTVKAETGAKGKALFMPLRLALTGQKHGPDMASLLPLIGRERALKRLAGEVA